jgi:Flp pilus assembly protein TadD
MTGSSSTGGRSSARWGIACALAAATLLLYAPVLHFDFVRYDDPHYVLLHPRLSRGLSWDNLRWSLTAFEVGNWHPLTLASHMADVSMFGMRAGAHHAVNALFHALNAALLFLLFDRMTSRAAPSLVTATLFAVHPLNVESVAWVSQRKGVLSMVFILLAAHLYVSWTRRGSAWRYAAALAASALALAAKPIAVVIPGLLLTLDVWPLSRFPAAPGERAPSPARLVLEKLPFALLAAAAAVATWAAQSAFGAVGSLEDHPAISRLAHAAFAFAWYLWRMVWPRDLSLFYPTTLGPNAPLELAASTALIAALALTAWACRSRSPCVTFGVCWYAIALAPVAGLVNFGTQIVADRYAYLALIGPFAAIAFTGADLASRWSPAARRAVVAVTCAAGLVLAFATGSALAPWRSSLSILERGYERAPENIHAIANLGLELVKLGRYGEAIPLLKKAAAQRPRYTTVHSYLGYAYAQTGRPADARGPYEEAVRLEPEDVEVATELGQVLVRLGENDEAEARFRQAVSRDPGFGAAWKGLALLLASEGRAQEAEPAFERAAPLRPGDVALRTAWAANLTALGRREEALAVLREAGGY